MLIPKSEFQYGYNDKANKKGAIEWYMIDNPKDSLSRIPPARVVSLDSFYINKYEVTNLQYREFLSDLRVMDPQLYPKMLPDTIIDRDYHYFGEPFVGNYFRHPAYDNHPALGISYNQATTYCYWLTKKYQKEQKRKFKNVQFKLPTVAQWTYAATSGNYQVRFPWDGWTLQNERGEWLANFKAIPQYHIGKKSTPNGNVRSTVISDGSYRLETSPVDAFEPNDLGIHNLAGNVEELVREAGISKGGSWKDTGYYLQTWVEEKYDTTKSASDERGFRVVMEIID